VHDRVGGGDGFAPGLFYGLLTGEPEQETVNLGWAHGALLTTFPRGDPPVPKPGETHPPPGGLEPPVSRRGTH